MDIAEQLCYIPCNFCNIILAVSVPCNSLFDVVTVRCGHCSNLWTVNMAAAAFHSQHHPSWQDLQIPSYSSAVGSSPRWNFMMPLHPPTFINKRLDKRLSNRPPEKRQRVPSAYNQFIKEEIQRIKANNPNITHREAFSTAAKNWAHFPHIHFGLMLETSNQDKPNEGTDKRQIRRPSVLP